VLLQRLVPKSFEKAEAGLIVRLLFVAVTRTSEWVYLSTTRGRGLPALVPLLALR